MGCRALHRNEKFIFKDYCYISVNSTIDIKTGWSHGSYPELIFLPIIYSNSKYIIFSGFYICCNIKIERTIPSLVIAKIFTIEPDFAIFLNAFKLNKNLPVGVFNTNRKVLPVPAPSHPPVRIIGFRSIPDKRMKFTSSFIGAPGMWNTYRRPPGIIESRSFVSFICTWSGEIIESPLGINYLFNTVTFLIFYWFLLRK